jgi:DNA-binding MurR/RpiR family transcriptional regulator
MLESPLNAALAPPGVRLTRQQLKIAQYLGDNLETASYASAQRLASEIGTNPSSVVRFAQALGYRGFRDLQELIRRTYLRKPSIRREPPLADESDGHHARSVVGREIHNLMLMRERLDTSVTDDLARAIAGAHCSVVLASGAHASVAVPLEQLGRLLGYNVMFEARGGWPAEVLVAGLTQEDLLIVVTFWWQDRSVVNMALRAAERGVPLAVISDDRYSAVSRSATYLLAVPGRGGSFFTSVVPALTAAYIVLESLALVDPERSQAAVSQAQQLAEDITRR